MTAGFCGILVVVLGMVALIAGQMSKLADGQDRT
jgi:hypothetical protein